MWSRVFGPLLILTLIAVSVSIRWKDFCQTTGMTNLEVSYHVLLTMEAYAENPVSEHYWLPIITLGEPLDKEVRWQGTFRTERGNYLYTSFTPPCFVFPYIFLELLDLPRTLGNLALFNVCLGAVTALILYFFLLALLEFLGVSRTTAMVCAVASTTIAIFSHEVLVSHGLIYWVHSQYQVALALTLLMFFKIVSGQAPATRLFKTGFAALMFAGPFLEWSGFVTNAALIAILWWNRQQIAGAKHYMLVIFLATLMAALAIVMYFSLALGFESTMNMLESRFFARATRDPVYTYAVLKGYALSFGLFAALILMMLALQLFLPSLYEGKTPEQARVLTCMLLATMLPLLENAILLTHVAQYSFDRLKFIFPAATILALLLSQYRIWLRSAVILLLVAASLQGIVTYRYIVKQFAGFTALDAKNHRLKQEIAKHVDLKKCVLCADSFMSCYPMTVFHRNIKHQDTPTPRPEDIQALLKTRNAEAVILLVDVPHLKTAEGDVWCDIYDRAVIHFKDGSVKEITVEPDQQQPRPPK